MFRIWNALSALSRSNSAGEKAAVALPAARTAAALAKPSRLARVVMSTSSISSLINVRMSSPMKRDNSISPCRASTPLT